MKVFNEISMEDSKIDIRIHTMKRPNKEDEQVITFTEKNKIPEESNVVLDIYLNNEQFEELKTAIERHKIR